jgi:hypothetical protein
LKLVSDFVLKLELIGGRRVHTTNLLALIKTVAIMPGLTNSQQNPTAIVGNAHGSTEVSHNAPIVQAKGDIFIVGKRTFSVNPVDAKMMGPYVTFGVIGGYDSAGVVEAMGPDLAS